MNLEITPVPSEEEVAAIAAAVEALWPKPMLVDTPPMVRRPTWRFSNRWWIVPILTRRPRPHR